MAILRYWRNMTVMAGLCLLWTISTCGAADVWNNLALYGGNVYDIAFSHDPLQPDKIFAGTYLGGGLYGSENGGSSWTPVETAHNYRDEDTFKNHAVWKVKVAPTDPNVVWAVHNHWAEVSSDRGQTWTPHFQP